MITKLVTLPRRTPNSPNKCPIIIATVIFIAASANGAHVSQNNPYPKRKSSFTPRYIVIKEIINMRIKMLFGRIYLDPIHSAINGSIINIAPLKLYQQYKI